MEDLVPDTNKKKRLSKVIVVENPTIDLDSYLNNYTGHGKIERSLFIAERCPSLQVEAYNYAIQELKNSLNFQKYLQVAGKLNETLSLKGILPVAVDNAWADTIQKQARAQSEKLEAELKNYKNNAIKESIRMGYKDLADHFYQCGDLAKASKYYSQTRDYCTTSKHMVEMCLNVIKVSIEFNNFAHVQSYVVKAESTPDLSDKNVVLGKLRCSSGLVNLDGAKFKRAARCFLETSFELGNQYSEIISANDIAIYGGLCALASFDRNELKSKVFDNADFKQYLELEPQIRELLFSFYNSKYATCLDLLAKMKNDLLLDIYLHNHVEAIYQNIRKKALVQYFSPFLSVDLNKMAAAFNTTVQELEPEIATLITENMIQARIDSLNKILKAKQSDQRTNIFKKSLDMGAEYRSQTKQLLLRMKLTRAELIVRGD